MNNFMMAAITQDVLDQSSNLLDRSLQADCVYADLTEQLMIPRHNQPSVSGLHDFDYPSMSDLKIGLNSMPEVTGLRKIPLPAELVEQFGHMQCNCLMGLFPEVRRAWLSIDSDIFVWDYEDGSDLAYFDGLNETILSAGLVKPKPGIFQPHISYLLCLTTPVDIVLLGVSFHKPVNDVNAVGEMHLLPEPLFSIPTDNVHMLNVTGAANGRIFMAGKDGCLYELYYQAEDGWFSRKCKKINHSTSKLSFMVPSFLNFSFIEDDPLIQINIDDSRHILYSRSEKGTIQVYDLGEDGKGMSRVAAISLHTTMQNAALVAKTIDRSNFKSIVHITAIPKQESVHSHLLAITSSGVRLYFTTSPFGDNRGRPSMLSLIHVRLPPGFSASASLQRPTNVHMAYYSKGTTLLCSSQSEDNDVLWTISSDSFPFTKQLMETQELMGVDGRTWALAEVPTNHHQFDSRIASQGPVQKANPPLVVTQHMEPTRRFVLLNSQGSYVMNKMTPADQLKHLLLNANGPDSEDVQSFFKLHKEDQACATCLILCCSYMNQAEQQVSEWATRAFFLFGGEAEYNFASAPVPHSASAPFSPVAGTAQGFSTSISTPSLGFNPNQVSTPYHAPGFSQSMSVMSSSAYPGQNTAQDVIFSGKHNGLCLYLGRILRPIWEHKMVADLPHTTQQGQMNYLGSRFRSEELSWFLEQLKALRAFMDKNSQFTSPMLAESYNITSHNMSTSRMMRDNTGVDEVTKRRYRAEANAIEKESLQNLQLLIHRICESLGLWKVICDHQFHVIASALTKDQQNAMRMMTFKQFITSGRDLASALIQCLIKRYLNDNAATDAISNRLREICPTLYSSDDAMCSKAHEMLQMARSNQNKIDKDTQLQDSLQLYKQITNQLDLPTVCNQFATVRFYTGVVDLCLTAASKRDPQNLALHYYRNMEPPEDVQGSYAFSARLDCYKCITDTLDFLLNTSQSHPQAPSVPRSPGPPPAQDPNTLSNSEAEQYSEQVFNLAVRCSDEMFHVSLYEWLISRHLTEKLLEIQSAYLEPYLKRQASLQPDHIAMLDLLWRYYEKTKNFSAAAGILAKLADRHSTDITLQQRIEYLSRATMSAKSSTMRTSSASEGEFLHELEEKMEVARLQLQLYETLNRGPNAHNRNVQEALSRLNSELVDITALYGEFADVHDLSECKLAIIHCAGHHDPTLVESLWKDIIEKEIESTISAPVHTQMNTLGNKLVSLGRMYSGTERYFPLPFLVKYLERRSCELEFDGTFVFKILQDMGVTVSKLHEIYDRLFKFKDPCWQAMRRPFHLLDVICHLLNGFADAPTLVPAYERRPFITTCLDSVASYQVELQATSSTDGNVRQLMDRFKNLQAKLDRML